jgi:hypothetical protein
MVYLDATILRFTKYAYNFHATVCGQVFGKKLNIGNAGGNIY